MHGLPRQLIDERRDPRPRFRGCRVHPRAVQWVGDVRNQFRHNGGAVPQIPLQHPVKAGMTKTLERPTHPPSDLA